MSTASRITMSLFAATSTLGAQVDVRSQTISAAPPSAASQLEEIYVMRSVRKEQLPKSEWCTPTRTGFESPLGESTIEERYSLWTLDLRSIDGRVTNAKQNKGGEGRACIALTTDPRTLNFYAEANVSGISFKGKGQCAVMQPDFPEQGVTAATCYLELRDLPAGYIGGMLTSNTVATRALGVSTDPPGYVQPSIATIRLWRAR